MARPKYTNKKPPLTHFLCLPLLTPISIPQLQKSLSSFKKSVAAPVVSDTPVSEDGDTEVTIPNPVIPEKAFRPLGVLHLTLGVMSLRTEEEINAARALLHSLNLADMLEEESESSKPDNTVPDKDKETSSKSQSNTSGSAQISPDILETLKRAVTPPSLGRAKKSAGPLVISLEGLQAFPKLQQATVLHCPPMDPTSRLYPFCLALRQKLVDAELIRPENRPLVLHATIVNTVYAKKDRRGEKKRMGSINFDATEIMHKYNEQGGSATEDATGAFVWAKGIVIDRVRICEMGAKGVDDGTLGQEYKVFIEKTV